MIQLSICNRQYGNELGFANDINTAEIYTNQNLQGMYFFAFYKWKYHIFRLVLRDFLNGQKRYDIWLRVAPWNSALLCELSLTFHNIKNEDSLTIINGLRMFSVRTQLLSPLTSRVWENIFLQAVSMWIHFPHRITFLADTSSSLLPPWRYYCYTSTHPEHWVYVSPTVDSRVKWFYIYSFKHLK